MTKLKIFGWVITRRILGWENDGPRNGSFFQQRHVRKIRVNRISMYYMIFLINIFSIYPQTTDFIEDSEVKNRRIE
jgi:hypothetical protein